jgi:hypothetical protein
VEGWGLRKVRGMRGGEKERKRKERGVTNKNIKELSSEMKWKKISLLDWEGLLPIVFVGWA